MPEMQDQPQFLVIPTEVVVLGQHFRVVVVEDRDSPLGRGDGSGECIGLTELSRQRIGLRGAGEMSEDLTRETLLHEVLHAVIGTARITPLARAGADDAHLEDFVGALAPVLLHTLRDNPRLVAALMSGRSEA